jgi:para-nitrobenzyl esterase
MRDRPWSPVAGTAVLPRQPGVALHQGSAAGVPLLVGSTRDEMSPSVGFAYDAGGEPLTVATYEAEVVATFGPDAAAVLERYPASGHPSPALALTAVLTDWGGQLGACSTLRTAQGAARHAPVFAFELTEDSGLVYEGFPLGAYHGWELPFLWDLSIPGAGYPELTPAQEVLSDRMVDYWSTFARTGDPNHRGAPRWARLRPGTGRDGTVLGLAAGDGGIAPVPFATAHRCDLWSGIEPADGADR